MDSLLPALVFSLVFMASAWGWGSTWARLTRERLPNWPLTALCGMAVLVGLGGILMALEAAGPLTLMLLLLAGLVPFLLRSMTLLRQRPFRIAKAPAAWVLLPVIVLGIALAARFTSPTAFNPHDDYEKYLTYPVRILENGALMNRVFDAVPLETLGGHAFLQAFVTTCLPLDWVSLTDTVIAATLLHLAIGLLALRATRSVAWALVLAALSVSLNPFYANTSSIYTSAALYFLAIYIVFVQACRSGRMHPCTLGLVLAALVTLKSLNLLPCVALALAGIVLGPWRKPGTPAWRHPAAQLILAGALASASWAWMYREEIIFMATGSHAAPEDTIPATVEAISMFSSKRLLYGAGESALTYTLILGFLLIAAGFASRSSRRWLSGSFLLAAALLAAYVLNLYVLSPALLGSDLGMRYIATLLIPGIPACYIAVLRAGPGSRERVPKACLALTLAIALPYGALRLSDAFQRGHMLSFSNANSERYFTGYRQELFSDWNLGKLQEIQTSIPAGEAILVWSQGAPLLDYRRNPIYLANTAGFANPWSPKPSGLPDDKDFTAALRARGIRHILFSIHDFQTREKSYYPGRRNRTLWRNLDLMRKEMERIAGEIPNSCKDDFYRLYTLHGRQDPQPTTR